MHNINHIPLHELEWIAHCDPKNLPQNGALSEKLTKISKWLGDLKVDKNDHELFGRLHRLCTNLKGLDFQQLNTNDITSITSIQKISRSILAQNSPRLPIDLYKEIVRQVIEDGDFATLKKFISLGGQLGVAAAAALDEEGIDLEFLGLKSVSERLDFVEKYGHKTLRFNGFSKFTKDDLKRIQSLKHVETLVIDSLEALSVEEEKQLIAGMYGLKYYGNFKRTFESFEEVSNYVKEFKCAANSSPDAPGLYVLNLDNSFEKKSFQITDDQYEQLLFNLPCLKILHIGSSGITRIPNQESLLEIDCSGCENLKSLKAPSAKIAFAARCHNLTELDAPQALKVNCYQSKVTRLDLPKALMANFEQCTELVAVMAPKTSEINCMGCLKLEKVVADSAQKVFCTNNQRLQHLEIPVAEEVLCKGCGNLTFLHAPKAKKLNAISCHKLKELRLDQAIEVECPQVRSLEVLIAPNARVVRCSSIPTLTKLVAPSAEDLECGGCSSLDYLDASRVKNLTAWGCFKLNEGNVIAPDAVKRNLVQIINDESE